MEYLEGLVGYLLDDRYLLRAVIGSGGSAVVFEADDQLLSRPVAIKMLRAEAFLSEGSSRVSTKSDAQKVSRSAFLREARAATVLAHPSIVTVYDVCNHRTNPYIVMELVKGKTLAAHLKKRGILSLEEILAFANDILLGLAEAHAHGVVHRDIKPENILLTRNGLKIADFGIAKLPGAECNVLQGRVLGSVDTISPEQASGRVTDARSDLYSLGVLLYRMATGRMPFTAKDPETVAFLHMSEPPKYPSTYNPAIAKGLEQIILCALAKNPNDRFPDAQSMLAAIKQLEKNPRHVFRRFGRAHRSPLASLGRHAAILSVSLGVVAAILCGAFAIVFGGKGILPTPVTIVSLPSYTQYTYPAVETELALLDSRISVTITRVHRPDLPEGTILAQVPSAGTLWKLDGRGDSETLVLIVTTQVANDSGLPPIFG